METFNLLFLNRLGTTEIVLILAIVLLLFGGRKIPEIMKGIGHGIKEFKNAMTKNYSEEEEKKEDKN